jgi:hypothetical protein
VTPEKSPIGVTGEVTCVGDAVGEAVAVLVAGACGGGVGWPHDDAATATAPMATTVQATRRRDRDSLTDRR